MLFQEIDHIGYVRQAFEAGSLSSFLEIIENDILRDFDVSELLVYSLYKNYISPTYLSKVFRWCIISFYLCFDIY